MIPTAVALSAWESVRAHPSRAALATVSVVLGVLALTLVSSLGSASENAIRRTIARSAGLPATLQADISEADHSIWNNSALQAHLERMRRDEVFSVVSPLSIRGVGVTAFSESTTAQMHAVAPSLTGMRAFDVTAGRWLDDDDARSFAPAAVVNVALSDALGIDPTAIMSAEGLTLGLEEPVGLRVVGVVDDAVQEPTLYVHHETLDRWSPPEAGAASILFRVAPERVRQQAAILQRSMEFALPGHDVQLFRRDNAASLSSVITTVSSLLTAMGLLALVVGSLGTLNLGLVTVRARARELGLRRAFGASSRDVFRIILTESLLTNLVAGLIGVLLAIPVTAMAPQLLQLPVAGARISGAFPLGAAAVGMAAAFGAGLLGGWIPARRATRLNVIEAIRS